MQLIGCCKLDKKVDIPAIILVFENKLMNIFYIYAYANSNVYVCTCDTSEKVNICSQQNKNRLLKQTIIKLS